MMLGMDRAFSRFQMCFNLCSIGDCGLEQKGMIWVKVAGGNELITFDPMFSCEKCATNNLPSGPCSKDTWLANPPRFVYLTVSSCCQELMENTFIQFSWFLSGLRIWNSGEIQWECLMSLADLSMLILINYYQAQETCGFGPLCAWHNRIFTKNTF